MIVLGRRSGPETGRLVLVALCALALTMAGTGLGYSEDVDERDNRLLPKSLNTPIPTSPANGQSLAPDAQCGVTFLPSDGGTSSHGRAPSVRYRGIKSVYLITAAELAASGLPSGVTPTGIGWHYSTAPGNVGAGMLTVYLQNTTDTTNNKAPVFATAIAGMTLVHNASTTLPDSTAPFDIPFSGGSGFSYLGAGLYVAFDWEYPVGTLSTTTVVASNLALTNGILSSESTSGTASNVLPASNFRPETRLTVGINNDVGVDYVITLGELPVGLVSPQTVRAVVTNRGAVRTNLPVTLNVTGAETYTNTKTIAALAGCGGQTTVSFDPFSPSVLGTDNVAVSVPADDFAGNNLVSKPLAVTVNRYSYKHPGTTAPPGGVGFTTTGELVARFNVASATQVDSLNLEFMLAGGSYRVVLYADSGTGTPGTQLYVDAADRTAQAGPVTVRLPSPVGVGPGNFFAGVQQTGTSNFGFSADDETPVRGGTFFFSTSLNTGPWTDFSPGDNFKLNVGVIVGSCLVPMSNSVTPDVAGVCAGNQLTFASTPAGGTGARTYQWTENGLDIVGQTGPSAPVTKAAAGSFHYNCKVSDDGACATSWTSRIPWERGWGMAVPAMMASRAPAPTHAPEAFAPVRACRPLRRRA
jgi:hypothetical protein